MTRFHPGARTIALALMTAAALAASAGAALAFNSMPSAATPGLERASNASGKTVPARPQTPGAPGDHDAATGQAPDTDSSPDVDASHPDNHGAAVSAVATADNATTDMSHGAIVSAVARANHGQATAAQHRPADAGKHADPGKPADPGKH